MKNLTWQNPEQLFVAQELINKVKSKCCGIKAYHYSGIILLICNSIRPVQHRHADQDTSQGCAKNDAVHNTRTTAPVLDASAARFSCFCPNTNPNGADRPPPGSCQSTPSYLCHQPFRLSQRPNHKKKSPTQRA